jgi:hypothetical protein
MFPFKSIVLVLKLPNQEKKKNNNSVSQSSDAWMTDSAEFLPSFFGTRWIISTDGG